ncbi:hypothetical protein [Salisaeta icosahedral phage 1]|uniref:hypothetical protein n=1 Tax=Salisaeta icosahedral phage 1 TaxID=1183239 RepID=UPI00025EA929|nr:hypothetical protein A322_gp28 [Salisaeta icosahedral phage 1]AFJ21483.1 hypothetical protein [Salisaeta icosahedral phage 1]
MCLVRPQLRRAREPRRYRSRADGHAAAREQRIQPRRGVAHRSPASGRPRRLAQLRPRVQLGRCRAHRTQAPQGAGHALAPRDVRGT